MARTERTWTAVHRRGEVLRAVVEEANARRDGILPVEVPGVAETFADDLALVAALQLRWHTRLAGRVERALAEEPMNLESGVLAAWRSTVKELAGVRQILDVYAAEPTSEEMARALTIARRKDWILLAAMAGRASAQDDAATRIGERLEQRARAAYDPGYDLGSDPRHRADVATARPTVLDRIKAALAA